MGVCAGREGKGLNEEIGAVGSRCDCVPGRVRSDFEHGSCISAVRPVVLTAHPRNGGDSNQSKLPHAYPLVCCDSLAGGPTCRAGERGGSCTHMVNRTVTSGCAGAKLDTPPATVVAPNGYVGAGPASVGVEDTVIMTPGGSMMVVIAGIDVGKPSPGGFGWRKVGPRLFATLSKAWANSAPSFGNREPPRWSVNPLVG